MKNKYIKFLVLCASMLAAAALYADGATVTVRADDYNWIRQDQPNAVMFPTRNEFKVGTLVGGNQLHGLLSFNLPGSIPTGAIITSVQLVMTTAAPDGGSASVTLGIYQLTDSFASNEVSWNNRLTDTPWVTPGGDYSETLLSSQDILLNTAASTALTWNSSANFVSLVQTAFDTGSDINLLLKLTSPTANRQIINLRGDTYPNSTPSLVIEYTIPEPGSSSLIAGAVVLVAGLVVRRFRRKC